jgi:peptidoglycan hydrolase-like protein with peptidoglycan-binding domain
MHGTRQLAAACAGVLLLGAAPAAADAAATPVPPPHAPAGPAPVTGKMVLALLRVGGSPPFALLGGRITAQGTIWPYVGGETVKVSIYRDGRKVSVKIVRPVPDGTGAARFRVSFSSASPGLVDVRAAHYATAAQVAFKARAPSVTFVSPNLGPGAQGQSVRLLQSELNVLHFAVPLSGVFDEGTGRAMVAYRKLAGLERVPYAGRHVFELLARHAGSFHVRYPGDGRHVEGDLTRQVLAEIEPGGRVRTIYTMSSGKPSTPTVVGRFRVYSKTPGTNSHGMVDSNYFIRGYAIHGYAEVPTYAASHGCLRVPIPDAAAIYGWVREGTPVDVYNEGGGGSNTVRGNAGP